MEPRWATARETGRAGVERSSRGRRWLASGDRLHLLGGSTPSARCPSSLVTATAILSLFFSPPPSSFSLLFRPSFVSPASHRLLVWFSSVASRATTWIPFSSPRVCVASAHPIRTTRLKNLPCGQAPGGPDLGEKQAVIFGEYEPVHKTGRRKQSSTAPCEECASMRGVRCQPSSCLKKAVMVAGSCLLAGEASRSSPSRAPKLPASYQASYMLPMQSPSLSPHVNKEIHCYGCMFQGWQIQEADFFHPDEPLTVPTHRSQSPINTVQDR